MQLFFIFLQKNLHISQKSSTFAPAFEKRPMLNGVMVALQILVLSVWVRVLVEQQTQQRRDLTGLFLVYIFVLSVLPRVHFSFGRILRHKPQANWL